MYFVLRGPSSPIDSPVISIVLPINEHSTSHKTRETLLLPPLLPFLFFLSILLTIFFIFPVMGHSHSQYPLSREIITTTGPIIGRRLVHEGEKLVTLLSFSRIYPRILGGRLPRDPVCRPASGATPLQGLQSSLSRKPSFRSQSPTRSGQMSKNAMALATVPSRRATLWRRRNCPQYPKTA